MNLVTAESCGPTLGAKPAQQGFKHPDDAVCSRDGVVSAVVVTLFTTTSTGGDSTVLPETPYALAVQR